MEVAKDEINKLTYVEYTTDSEIPAVKLLMEKYLSEPYPIFTYRYFLVGWPKLCFIVYLTNDNYLDKKRFAMYCCNCI